MKKSLIFLNLYIIAHQFSSLICMQVGNPTYYTNESIQYGRVTNYTNLGIYYMFTSQESNALDTAEKFFKKAINVSDNDNTYDKAAALVELGQLERMKGNKEQSLKYTSQALQTNSAPDIYALAQSNLSFYMTDNETKRKALEAILTFNDITKQIGIYSAANYGLALIATQENKIDEAIKKANKATVACESPTFIYWGEKAMDLLEKLEEKNSGEYFKLLSHILQGQLGETNNKNLLIRRIPKEK